MPYSSNEALPPAIRHHLPAHGQDIFRAAFNNAYSEYRDEAAAFRVAWAAVKKSYAKHAGIWVPRNAGGRAGDARW